MRRKWRWLLFSILLATALGWVYVETRPLVFMGAHAHCMKYAGLSLGQYASQHEGRYPVHPNGYPSALLLMDEDAFYSLTGPGYDSNVLRDAKRQGKALNEEDCGRVYIQGLTNKSNPEIALFFDKLPTPGGDHCHLPMRLWAPLGREVYTVGMQERFVRESDWPEFVTRQVDLLTKEGFDRNEVERLFASRPK
jgi:hypothetical protein